MVISLGIVLLITLIPAIAGCSLAGRQVQSTEIAIVVAHHANELSPSLADSDRQLIRRAVADPGMDNIQAYVVAAGRPAVETVDLKPRRPNGHAERGPRREHLIAARLEAVDEAVERAATQTTDVDLLRALAVAARGGAETIIMLSAGLSTNDPLDMRVTGWDLDPRELAADLSERKLLPNLEGRSVVFSGLGRTAGQQPPLGIPEQAMLREEWTEICIASGAAACEIDDAVRPATPPVSVLRPPIVAPQLITTTQGMEGQETITVPAPLLFLPDRCELLDGDGDGAARLLAPMAGRLRAGGVTVTISGRTAPIGPGDGRALGTCRAHAAADLLFALGVPHGAVTEIRGDGSLLDPPSASRDAHGRVDSIKLAALRRVVFTLTPTSTEPR
jgi:hypothetical protein